MKYNITPELTRISLPNKDFPENYKHGVVNSDELSQDQMALIFEASQVLDKDKKPPTDQKNIKYIYSRSFKPYELFQYKFGYLKFKGLVGGTIISSSKTNFPTTVTANDIFSTNKIDSQIINLKELSVSDIAEIKSISTTSITSTGSHPTNLSSTIGIINNIYGNDKLTYDLGFFTDISVENEAKLIAMRAKWADIAELYHGDTQYEPGTLVKFGGTNELTLATDYANGCISEKPAILMNTAIRQIINSVPLLLTGKTKVKINGSIKKFDKIELSDIPGIARKHTNKQILGIALESNENTETKLVKCIIKLMI